MSYRNGACLCKCSAVVWTYACDPRMITAGKLKHELKDKGGFLKRESWWEKDTRTTERRRSSGQSVKASSVRQGLRCFPWGPGPGSGLAEQINREEVHTLITLTPSHVYSHEFRVTYTSFTCNSLMRQLTWRHGFLLMCLVMDNFDFQILLIFQEIVTSCYYETDSSKSLRL